MNKCRGAAFLVTFFIISALTFTFTNADQSPSTSRFPNLLAPLRNIFTKRLTASSSSQKPQQSTPVVTNNGPQQQHPVNPVPLPLKYVHKDLAEAESNSAEDFGLGGYRPYFSSSNHNNQQQHGFDSPRPQTFRKPRPMMSHHRPSYQQQQPEKMAEFMPEQHGQRYHQRPRPHHGGGGRGQYEQFKSNEIGFDERPKPSHGQRPGPEFLQSQPQSRPSWYAGNGNNNRNKNNNGAGARPHRVYPYPSVRGVGRQTPFRPSRPDSTHGFAGAASAHGFPGADSNNLGFLPTETFNPAQELSESFEQFPRSTRAEPQIITLDDIQQQQQQQQTFQPVAHPLIVHDQSNENRPQQRPPTSYQHYHRDIDRPTNSHTRQIPVFALPNHNKKPIGEGKKPQQIFASRPLRSPGGKLNPFKSFKNNDGKPKLLYKHKQQMQSRPPPGAVQDSNEEIFYGKPMPATMMMSSTNHGQHPNHNYNNLVDTQISAPPLRNPYSALLSSAGSEKKPLIKPFLLKATKNPNYKPQYPMIMSSSDSDEPYQSASSFGGGGEGGGDAGFNGLEGSNGDRILYHVSGHKGPYSYRWGYDTGKGYNRMFRFEEKDETGYVKGKYGFQDKHGKMNVVNYEAHPQNGYHQQ